MTQIIAAMTADYVILAADRRLTFIDVDHSRDPTVKDDDTCKLVSLYGVGAFGYTGYADLEGRPTHKWIAIQLARRRVKTPLEAACVLRECATRAIAELHPLIEMTILYVGWWPFGRDPDYDVRPHLLMITNRWDESGRPVPPSRNFVIRGYIFSGEKPCNMEFIGYPITTPRILRLCHGVRRGARRKVTPQAILLQMVRELRHSAGNTLYVGSKALAVCIPRASAERYFRTRSNVMVAAEANLGMASFCYFDPNFSKLQQYGPTSVFGSTVVTSVTTGEDGDSQFSEIEFTVVPTTKGAT